MRRIAEAVEARYEIKGSRFLSHLVPIEAVEALRERLRTEHPKASHIVMPTERSTTTIRSSKTPATTVNPMGALIRQRRYFGKSTEEESDDFEYS